MKFFKKILVIGALLISSTGISQELVINDAANLVISPAANLIFSNGMNLVNNSSAGSLNGTFVFRGSFPQEISGSQPFTLANLNIEEGAFVSLLNNVAISEGLNLTNGMINLLENNLKILSGASINGSFSETAMIVAEGPGKLEMEIAGDGIYFFPVGDTSNVNEYSPAKFEFSSGNYSNALLSVNLRNSKHPENPSSSNYLKRYWSVSQSGITNINCNVDFEYTNEDIVGNESGMIGARWNGNWWYPINDGLSLNKITGAVNEFADFTGGEQEVLQVDDIQNDDVGVIVQGRKITLTSSNDFQLRRVEIFNKLGQAIQTIFPANALHHEFSIHGEPDIYFLRLSSNDRSITKKIFVD